MKLIKYAFFPVFMVISITTIFWSVSADYHPKIFSLLLPGVALVCVAIFERFMPINAEWNKNDNDRHVDISSFVAVALVTENLVQVFIPLLAVFAISHLDFGLGISLFKGMPLWLEAILVTLLIEFGRYWFHRWSHENDFGWRFHSSHHSVKRMYWLNGFRLHPIYHIMVSIVAVLPVMILGASQQSLIIYSTLLGVMAAFQHANVDFHIGPLNRIFSTNDLHVWHHSIILKEGFNNYGAMLSIYDQVFKTYYRRPNEKPQILGIDNEDKYPMRHYGKQLLIPFFWKKWMSKE